MKELFKINVTEYKTYGELPNPFLKADGTEVTKKEEWEGQRKEIYKAAVDYQYGGLPPMPEFLEVENTYFAGRGKGSTYVVHTGTKERPMKFRFKLFLPNTDELCPVVVDGDACFEYAYDKEFIAKFLDNNIAFALFDRTEIAHDVEGGRGCSKEGAIYETYPMSEGYTYGTISAWAWSYSRVVDALIKIGLVDTSLIAFTGHSRGGKTAILAGAVDERVKIVNPNATCAGGCSCNRLFIKAVGEDGVERPSETAADLARVFPYWLSDDFNNTSKEPEKFPFDSHYLKALVAPRTLLVTEAGSDIWANPVGSWQTTMAAKEVYKFLGVEDKLYWGYRNGTHWHHLEDVQKLVDVILHEKEGREIGEGFFEAPFDEPELMFKWKAPQE